MDIKDLTPEQLLSLVKNMEKEIKTKEEIIQHLVDSCKNSLEGVLQGEINLVEEFKDELFCTLELVFDDAIKLRRMKIQEKQLGF